MEDIWLSCYVLCRILLRCVIPPSQTNLFWEMRQFLSITIDDFQCAVKLARILYFSSSPISVPDIDCNNKNVFININNPLFKFSLICWDNIFVKIFNTELQIFVFLKVIICSNKTYYY